MSTPLDAYELGEPLSSPDYRGALNCTIDEAAAYSRAEARPSKPVDVLWPTTGQTLPDVMWTTSPFPMIVSERFVGILRAAQLSGWTTYPIAVTGTSGEPVDGFHGLAITGRCGRPDLEQSELVLREFPGGWIPGFRGWVIDRASWDGSDFFMERADERGNSSGYRFVSERAYCAISQAQIPNLRLTRLCEVEVPTSQYEFGATDYMLPKGHEARVIALYARAGHPVPAFIREEYGLPDD